MAVPLPPRLLLAIFEQFGSMFRPIRGQWGLRGGTRTRMKLTWANRITILRILLIAPFIIVMLNVHDSKYGDWFRYLALLVFLSMAVGDGLDGYLARKRNQVTKLGSFLDPMGDKLLMTSALLLLASSRSCIKGFELPDWVVVLIIGKDLFLLVGFVIVYFITFQVRIVPAKIGKAATAIQLALVASFLVAPDMVKIAPWWRLFLQVLWWSAAITAILATLIYIRKGIRYIEEFDQQVSRRNG
jgi:CDP-diacylglycerol--glycerol-3-phosphate 3-phosphatidyltransferase